MSCQGSWKDQHIARLLELPPDGFECLAQRILREAGFVNVAVMGKSGDGGLDDMGTYRLSQLRALFRSWKGVSRGQRRSGSGRRPGQVRIYPARCQVSTLTCCTLMTSRP